MLCARNFQKWNRTIRLVTGLAFLALAYLSWGVSNIGVGAGVVGVLLAVNNFRGLCPLCALMDRKQDKGV